QALTCRADTRIRAHARQAAGDRGRPWHERLQAVAKGARRVRQTRNAGAVTGFAGPRSSRTGSWASTRNCTRCRAERLDAHLRSSRRTPTTWVRIASASFVTHRRGSSVVSVVAGTVQRKQAPTRLWGGRVTS